MIMKSACLELRFPLNNKGVYRFVIPTAVKGVTLHGSEVREATMTLIAPARIGKTLLPTGTRLRYEEGADIEAKLPKPVRIIGIPYAKGRVLMTSSGVPLEGIPNADTRLPQFHNLVVQKGTMLKLDPYGSLEEGVAARDCIVRCRIWGPQGRLTAAIRIASGYRVEYDSHYNVYEIFDKTQKVDWEFLLVNQDLKTALKERG